MTAEGGCEWVLTIDTYVTKYLCLAEPEPQWLSSTIPSIPLAVALEIRNFMSVTCPSHEKTPFSGFCDRRPLLHPRLPSRFSFGDTGTPGRGPLAARSWRSRGEEPIELRQQQQRVGT